MQTNKRALTFIDLFAGICGFHLAFHRIGAEYVFASEWDTSARETYIANFKKINPKLFEKHFIVDITLVKDIKNHIPDFDILTGGFPCQPFSNAGLRKGFNDTRGTLFFTIAEILRVKRPRAFFIENVRGLLNHDNGRTFGVIQNTIEKDLGYSFYYKIIKACDYGLPQLRPRLFMVGFRDRNIKFEFPEKIPIKISMSHIWGGTCSRTISFTLRCGGRGSNINDRRNWDSCIVDGKVKWLSSKQAKQMHGFPDDFKLPKSETQATKQLGNSVAVDAVQIVARI